MKVKIMPMLRRLPLLAQVLLLFLAACTSAPEPTTGAVQFAASVQQALSASDVTHVKVTVSAADMSSLVVDLSKSKDSWGGIIGNIPAGSNRAFLAEAFDSSGTKRLQGQTSGVTIIANETTAVAITLQEVAPPPPYGNEAPIIDSVVASTVSVQTGGSISLRARAHDPNPADTLTFAWTASGGAFSTPTAATTAWTAPSSIGIQTLTFTVTDSQGAAVSVSLSVNVISGLSTGEAAVNIAFNLWPVVSKVSASLNRLDAGQSTTVSASAADADGDALSYQWVASCAGTWTNDTSSTASFVPSSIPASACNNCLLTVTVQDARGGQTTGALNLCVASSSTAQFPPLVTHYYQSASSVSPGQFVDFDVTAMDPQASSLTFAWTANTGSLGIPASGASNSHLTWTAPSCASASPTVITVTVTNAFNLTTSKSFTVTGLPACTVWAPASPMTSPHFLHSATLLPNGTVLVSGGYNARGYLATTEVYDPATGTWSAAAPMKSPRGNHTMTLLLNGKVLVAGGENESGYLATTEVYDPAMGTWSTTGSLASARSNPIVTLLPNGKVLVSAGVTSSGLLAAAEVYDPATGTWSATGSLASARSEHTATLLPGGKVLVSGGVTLSGASAKTEIYDPTSGTWSTAAPMASARYAHTATLLPDGKVLVSGGYDGSVYLADSEVYDPATGTWSTTGSMASARTYHTATLLLDGKVLVAGGYDSGDYLATVEVYDPATCTWSTTGSMASPRYVHTATLLPGGKVLVSGGYNGSYLATVELYTP